ncbi:MAG: winged helix-turn-helix domain-containing protein [Methanomassiliicoccales archaeon]
MEEEALLLELKALRNELNHLNEKMVHMRYHDFQSVFFGQMHMAVGLEGKRTFDSFLESCRNKSSCNWKEECLPKLEQTVNESIRLVSDGDIEGAIELINSLDSLIRGGVSLCSDRVCSSSTLDSLEKIRAILGVYRALSELSDAGWRDKNNPPETKPKPTPEEMEKTIAPLANVWRLRILRMLSISERTLSEISKELGLPTGHLQFHMRKLRDVNYISLDRRRGSYRLTAKGKMVLEGVEHLTTRI